MLLGLSLNRMPGSDFSVLNNHQPGFGARQRQPSCQPLQQAGKLNLVSMLVSCAGSLVHVLVRVRESVKENEAMKIAKIGLMLDPDD